MSDEKRTMRNAHKPGYEPDSVTLKPILLTGAVLVSVFVGVVVLIQGVEHFLWARHAKRSEGRMSAAYAPALSEPRLETHPNRLWETVRAQDEAWLTSYGWVDPQAGIAHIPIERAMELVLEEGLPTRAASSGEAKAPSMREPNE